MTWRQGREIEIVTDTPQAVWTDGEYSGDTPIKISVVPSGLTVLVPEPTEG